MANFTERVYWHNNSYGNAFRIPRASVITGLVIGCLLTPCTNWLIPFATKIVKEDMVFRY